MKEKKEHSKEEIAERIAKARAEYDRSGTCHRRDLAKHIAKLMKIYQRMP